MFCSDSYSLGLRIFSCFFFFQSTGPFVDCQNSCCEKRPCLNGGTCHETCDILGKRFRCECGPHATGNLCETGKNAKHCTHQEQGRI